MRGGATDVELADNFRLRVALGKQLGGFQAADDFDTLNWPLLIV
jgi:hypothetical protein